MEDKRHNLAMEDYNAGNLRELYRHNLATEANATGNLAEYVRHNQVGEGLTSRQLDEAERHDLRTESLTDDKQRSDRELRSQELDAQIQHYTNTDTFAEWNANVNRDLAAWKKQLEYAKLAIDAESADKNQVKTVADTIQSVIKSAQVIIPIIEGIISVVG